jgi:hypothetical protein
MTHFVTYTHTQTHTLLHDSTNAIIVKTWSCFPPSSSALAVSHRYLPELAVFSELNDKLRVDCRKRLIGGPLAIDNLKYSIILIIR